MFGKDQAMKILQNEKVCGILLPVCINRERNLPLLKETFTLLTRIVEEENIDCDFWKGHTFGSQNADVLSILPRLSSPHPQMLR